MKNNLREAREACGLTIRQVSKMLGLTFQAVSQAELRPNDPTLSTARKYAKLYGAEIDHLFPPGKDKTR